MKKIPLLFKIPSVGTLFKINRHTIKDLEGGKNFDQTNLLHLIVGALPLLD